MSSPVPPVIVGNKDIISSLRQYLILVEMSFFPVILVETPFSPMLLLGGGPYKFTRLVLNNICFAFINMHLRQVTI